MKRFVMVPVLLFTASSAALACGPRPWSESESRAWAEAVGRVVGRAALRHRRFRSAPSLRREATPRLGDEASAAAVGSSTLEVRGVSVQCEGLRVRRVEYGTAGQAFVQASRMLILASTAEGARFVTRYRPSDWLLDAPLADRASREASDRAMNRATLATAHVSLVFIEARGREVLIVEGRAIKSRATFERLRSIAWGGRRAQTCPRSVAGAYTSVRSRGEEEQAPRRSTLGFALELAQARGPLWAAIRRARAQVASRRPPGFEVLARPRGVLARGGEPAQAKRAEAFVLAGGAKPQAPPPPRARCTGCTLYCDVEELHPDLRDRHGEAPGSF